MSTLRHQNHCRRSQSASPSPLSARAREMSWRVATKRASPHSLAKDASSSYKWEVDIGGRGKRRRQDTPVSNTQYHAEIPPFVFGDRFNATAPFTSFFATKASDFELISRRDCDAKLRCRSDRFVDTRPENLDIDDEHDLSHLRSNAFWELHRSVAESGEGLVRRMRDYEHSRSRTDAYHKAKEAHKRGRKRSSIVASSQKQKHNNSSPNYDEEEEDDDVQIFAGDLPRISLPGSPAQNPSMCLDIKDMDAREYHCPASTTREFSSPFKAHVSSPSEQPSNEEQCQCSSSTDSPTTYSAPLHTVCSSCHMLSVHPGMSHEHLDAPLILPSFSPLCCPTSSSSRTEKAIAALSLAMANGAGGIADYEALLSVQAWPSIDDWQVGEMWH
ncbi:hypothetical protein C0993_007670 [Termitomyces sp. T159_Od127]|nr:hypothetical protein C0993_007670 [Termitomyces sp. T159_Od127]